MVMMMKTQCMLAFLLAGSARAFTADEVLRMAR